MTFATAEDCMRKRTLVRHCVFKGHDRLQIEAMLSPGSRIWDHQEGLAPTIKVTHEWYVEVRDPLDTEGIVYTTPARLLEPVPSLLVNA